jgi:hypothetical protein
MLVAMFGQLAGMVAEQGRDLGLIKQSEARKLEEMTYATPLRQTCPAHLEEIAET